MLFWLESAFISYSNVNRTAVCHVTVEWFFRIVTGGTGDIPRNEWLINCSPLFRIGRIFHIYTTERWGGSSVWFAEYLNRMTCVFIMMKGPAGYEEIFSIAKYIRSHKTCRLQWNIYKWTNRLQYFNEVITLINYCSKPLKNKWSTQCLLRYPLFIFLSRNREKSLKNRLASISILCIGACGYARVSNH